MALRAGGKQRRCTVLIRPINVHALVQQEPRRVSVAVLAGDDQRRPTVLQDELLRYARNRYVEAAVDPDRYAAAADELGAVNAARDRIIAPAAPSESVSRSRSGRDGASVISDSSLFSNLSALSFVSEREALQRLHGDMLENRVRVDTIPGLKRKKKKKKVKKAIAKELNRWGKKIEKAFKM